MTKIERVTYDKIVGNNIIIGATFSNGEHSTVSIGKDGQVNHRSKGLLSTLLWAERQSLIVPKRGLIIPLDRSIVANAKRIMRNGSKGI